MKQTFIVAMILCGYLVSINALAQTNKKADSIIIESEKIVLTTELFLQIKGMSCQAGCANGIDNMLKDQKGIVSSKTHFDTSSSIIKYNREDINEMQIIALIEDRGYKVKKKPDQK